LTAAGQLTLDEADVFAERDGRRHLYSKATVTMAVVALAE
ncbi:PaaI family thioesterase, partial [Pseudomonas aeruginosa]